MEHRDGICILQVMLEALPAQPHMGEADGIENVSDLVIAQECGIEFYKRVEMLLCQHVGTDGLDLLRRTAVHG